MKDIVKRQEESYDGNETGTSDAYSIRNDSLLKNTRTRSCGLYAKTGNELLEWQQLLQCDIMAVNDDGLWMHQKYGYSVPRRNGKSENVLAALPMGTEKRRKNSIHGTQSNNITRSVGAAGSNVRKAGIKISSSFKAFGKEHLYTSDGGVVEFRTRTSSGGLGEGYDVLIIDEAQEYTEAQETSLKYIVSDSENPQTIMLGTPPTAVSAGTVFTNVGRQYLPAGDLTLDGRNGRLKT